MPKKRPPKEIWADLRQKIWKRDGGRCVRCSASQLLTECHIDHIRSGKLADNSMANLRTLCRRCHVLRSCHRHQGMIAGALRDGVIGPDWRSQVWGG